MAILVHSRLLIGDFIPNDEEEKEIINKLNSWDFTESQHNDNMPNKFSTENIEVLLNKLKSVCKYDTDPLDYIKNMFFWIFKYDILPLKVIIIEVILENEKIENLNKDEREVKISRLSSYLGDCFNADSIINRDLSNNLNILNFSCEAIHNITIRNFVAEFFINAESEFISDLNTKLCWLETFKNAKFGGEYKIQHEKNIRDIKEKIISIDPLSFNGSSFYRSVIHGCANKMFIIGKIGQGNLKDSPPLYLAIISEESATSKSILDQMPILQSLGYSFLDFSYSAEQILLLQLLNSWNRYLEKSINDITTKHTQFKSDNKNFDNVIKELHDLISYRDTNEKISTNFKGNLQNLIDPIKNTILHEVLIPLKEDTPLLTNPEKYGWLGYGPIVSNLAFIILDYLDLNEKNLLDAINLRRSEIEVLKTEEDKNYSEKTVKYSRIMLWLTIVIAIATIVNVVLFILRI